MADLPSHSDSADGARGAGEHLAPGMSGRTRTQLAALAAAVVAAVVLLHLTGVIGA
jgi:hypothetical protein